LNALSKVLVDTTVWSSAFRRDASLHDAITVELTELIRDGSAAIIGPIRQEILSGVADGRRFAKLCSALAAFPDEPIIAEDYVRAAACFNTCRRKGVQGSHVDFLICAVATRLATPIFTLDKDFEHFAKALPIRLHNARLHPRHSRSKATRTAH
jgi:predicted nucleic acid-binding protein